MICIMDKVLQELYQRKYIDNTEAEEDPALR